jgi:hypothetical protein
MHSVRDRATRVEPVERRCGPRHGAEGTTAPRGAAVSHAGVTVALVAAPDDTPRVTVSMLRRAETMCRLRMRKELAGAKRYANRGSDARFAVTRRLEEDARLAHAELGPPRTDAFVDPHELEPEQRAVYRAAAAGYVALFGDDHVRTADLGWSTPLIDAGVHLVANPGLAVEDDNGRRELRALRLTRSRTGGPTTDPVSLRVALVRTASWAPESLRVIGCALLDHDVDPPFAPGFDDLPAAREEALEWITARVALVQDLAEDGRARAGNDCHGCPFVAGCPEHR